MFAQFIEGPVSDPDELERRFADWHEELAPTAEGWLGSTGGVTDDGIGFMAVRFESRDAAEANSQRSEQDAWWKETEACFDGEVDFLDCDEVELMLGGGSDDAGFVQVIRGRFTDLDRARAEMEDMDEEISQQRPDVIGGYAGVRPDGTFAQVVYFTSEEEARRGEAAAAEETDDFFELLAEPPRFLDLKDPWLAGP